MISQLNIRNLILVQEADIHFGPGLNIITGETGSGKSAILTAIRLILGERADVSLIRKGATLAVVEATIAGALVRREIHASGRSRCFIDDELVSLQELRTRLSTIELVDQSASLNLIKNELKFLDAYIGAQPFNAFHELQAAQKKLDELILLEQTSKIEQERMEEDLTFIEEVNWKAGEDENLQKEHHLLTNSADMLEKITALTTFLQEGNHPVLPTLKRLSGKIEPYFSECAEWLKIATLNLEEAAHYLTSQSSRLEMDPARLFAIETRVGEIESIKRRFGSYDQVEQLRTSLKTRLAKLTNLESEIESARKELQATSNRVWDLAKALTEKRKKGAASFAKAITSELQELNLPDVRFTIDIQEKPLSDTGADAISYLFAANPGQPLLPLDRCASGGELSRLLFAIKTALGSKEGSTCLIFDEIDSNVGGKTASILGAKLETMAASRQLICVTHFVQVAKRATDHFLVSKQTSAQEATTLIKKILGTCREQEYNRMTGG